MNLIKYILIGCFMTSYAQYDVLVADYTFTTEFEQLPRPTSVDSRLISNGQKETFEMDYVGDMNYVDEEPGVDGGSILAIKAEKNPIIFKENDNKQIYSLERVLLKPFLVKDSMNLFNWKIHNDVKVILGYNCQKATTHYRGRNYIAFFTTDIPFKTGPWKFYGLPGLILKVESEDGVLKIGINKIEIKQKTLEIDNPYEKYKQKPIKWVEYVEKYSEKYNELKSYRDQYGSKISIPKKLIETVVNPKYLFTKD